MIDILMATYNGGKYIENQIFSLLSQTYKDWRLLIHDDGSIDDTLDIIKKYQKLDSRIRVIEDGIKFGNAGENFLHLIKFADAKFVVFCDQDDIWFESKLLILLNQLQPEPGPAAVYCNAYAYDGNIIRSQKVSFFERNTLSNSIFLNSGVQGSSLMFNRALLELIRELPSYIYMHDHYITMMAVSFGKLLYVNQSLMLYRQHDHNVTGNVPKSFVDRLKSFFNRQNPIIDRRHYNANKALFEKFEDEFTDYQTKLYKAYLDFPNKSTLIRGVIVLKYGFRVGRFQLALLFKILYKKIIN